MYVYISGWVVWLLVNMLERMCILVLGIELVVVVGGEELKRKGSRIFLMILMFVVWLRVWR